MVFVSTVGYPTYQECLEGLAAQDSKFTLKIVDHVAPMSAALQRMQDECTTPYYVQVDEDMLLYPQAIRTLHERISGGGAQGGPVCVRSVRCSSRKGLVRTQDLPA